MCESASGGLKELDRISRRIVEEDLLPAGSGDDLAAESHARRAKAHDLGLDVVDDEVDAVPAARAGPRAVRHRTSGGACWTAQQDAKWPADDVGESRSHVRAQGEPEVRRVEGDRGVDVLDHVPNVDRTVCHDKKLPAPNLRCVTAPSRTETAGSLGRETRASAIPGTVRRPSPDRLLPGPPGDARSRPGGSSHCRSR